MDKDKLVELAERCEAATGPDREIDGDIEALLRDASHRHQIPSTWPRYTASLDAAMTLAGGCMLVALSDIAADGLTGCCLCSDTSTNPPTEHWGVPQESGGMRQEILARAVCAAALRSHAQKEEG